jgi:predicted component of type VI protein secretion system
MSELGSPMAEMSRAIRTTVQKHGPRLRDLPSEVLKDFEQIVSAYALDLRAEIERRKEQS